MYSFLKKTAWKYYSCLKKTEALSKMASKFPKTNFLDKILWLAAHNHLFQPRTIKMNKMKNILPYTNSTATFWCALLHAGVSVRWRNYLKFRCILHLFEDIWFCINLCSGKSIFFTCCGGPSCSTEKSWHTRRFFLSIKVKKKMNWNDENFF